MPQATLKLSTTVTWAGVPVQRCTVHKERNLLAHAPKALHEEIKTGCSDMMYAQTAGEAIVKRKSFLKKWRPRCRGVANSLEEAGERLFTLPRLSAEPMEAIAHRQRDRAPARAAQAPDRDPVRPAHS
jgi:transposase-like protein